MCFSSRRERTWFNNYAVMAMRVAAFLKNTDVLPRKSFTCGWLLTSDLRHGRRFTIIYWHQVKREGNRQQRERERGRHYHEAIYRYCPRILHRAAPLYFVRAPQSHFVRPEDTNCTVLHFPNGVESGNGGKAKRCCWLLNNTMSYYLILDIVATYLPPYFSLSCNREP